MGEPWVPPCWSQVSGRPLKVIAEAVIATLEG